METEKKYNRYHRQILLKEFGTTAQDKLLSAKVLVIGAGGLGCPALQYLAAVGVGQIGIVDFDVVELSNLQRQVLYTTEDIGLMKAETAGKKISALNPEIKVEIFNKRLQNTNTLGIISKYDIVLDGTDNFATRYMVNDACVILNKPLVYGAVLKYEGQVGVFNLLDNATNLKTDYRDVFPVSPVDALSCNEVGVLGVLPGIIGAMQAAEVIKIITEIGKPLCNQILTYNALNNSFYTIEISKNKNSEALVTRTEKDFLKFNYEWFCKGTSLNLEITQKELDTMRKVEKITLIDVREYNEQPLIDDSDCIKMPLSLFENCLNEMPPLNKVVLICKTGKRSMGALELLKKKFPELEAFSLRGGLDAQEIDL